MSVAVVTEIFRRVLDTDDVGETSDFFALGGDSLLATRVLSAVAREYGVELSFEDFVDGPSPDLLFSTIVSVSQ
ncbi:acyl carrier protein [Solwaraspora sp. WMMD406]|uniref:acyl carrier protein n=1 Tax=Solwaraspora sp. WMMD406 TaxID=3016095 RepID=UPI0024180041|nr:acyl carrier protein [Solwaraspora sp. WMMD406]MDG4765019.1 acyl carrier protein [Solwaraspora sp. WMMD406]